MLLTLFAEDSNYNWTPLIIAGAIVVLLVIVIFVWVAFHRWRKNKRSIDPEVIDNDDPKINKK